MVRNARACARVDCDVHPLPVTYRIDFHTDSNGHQVNICIPFPLESAPFPEDGAQDGEHHQDVSTDTSYPAQILVETACVFHLAFLISSPIQLSRSRNSDLF